MVPTTCIVLPSGVKSRFRWETGIILDSNFKRLIKDNETQEENAPVSTNARTPRCQILTATKL